MNDQLMQELVKILRAMHEGSPEAFRILVAERSSYCWACAVAFGVSCIVLAVIAMLCGVTGERLAKQAERGGPSYDGGCHFAAFIMGLVALVLLGGAMSCGAEAYSPLGALLGRIG